MRVQIRRAVEVGEGHRGVGRSCRILEETCVERGCLRPSGIEVRCVVEDARREEGKELIDCQSCRIQQLLEGEEIRERLSAQGRIGDGRGGQHQVKLPHLPASTAP